MYKTNDLAMHLVLLGLPPEIFASMDCGKNTHVVWESLKRLMHGTNIEKQEMETKLSNKLDKFTSIPGESIESYYHRFCKVMNDLARNELNQKAIANNIKFLNSLQQECAIYVTIVHQTKDLHQVNYDQLYNFLK